MAKVLIDKDAPLNPGDRVELHFKSSGMAWIKAAQIAIIDARLSNRKDWRIKNFQTPVDQPTLLICTVEVLKDQPESEPEMQTAGVGVTCAIIAATVVACGIVYGLTLQKSFLIARDVAQSPAGQVAVAGTGIGIAAAGIAALALIFLPKK